MTGLVAENQRAGRPERIGRYKVVDRIGRGAMGVVYPAHDELMGREVAVKVMMTDLEGEPDIRARFMREARSPPSSPTGTSSRSSTSARTTGVSSS